MNYLFLIFISTSTFFISSDAFAYLDPGSGSFIVQTILGLLAAIGGFFVYYFNKIKEVIAKCLRIFEK